MFLTVCLCLSVGTAAPLSEHLSVDTPDPEAMTNDLACYFGVDLDSKMDHLSSDYDHNQVFSKSRYAELVTKLVAKRDSGDAVVVELNLTTIANERWGIKAGFDVHLVVMYMNRASKWDKQLPAETRDMIYPQKTSCMSGLFKKNVFEKGFPNLPTVACGFNAAESNALANFSGWMVKENMDIFDKLFNSGSQQ